VLDVGCGYGSLVHFLSQQGFAAEGWDHDPDSVAASREVFPDAPVKLIDVEHAELADGPKFHSVILKDSLHHLVGEGDVKTAFQTIRGLLEPGGRLVILDPNPMWILRIARNLASHLDPEATLPVALQVVKEAGFEVKGVEFFETIGLPLSGGYVGPKLVPEWPWAKQLVASTNQALSTLAESLGIAPHVCWRYLIHADMLPETKTD
jgi:SAM-dependent methyltransferase